MRLLDWMTKTDIDVLEASRAFGVSVFAVKKWLKRRPNAPGKTQDAGQNQAYN